MSAVQVSIPTPLLLVVVMTLMAIGWVVVVARLLDLLARIARYRSYRRSYPAAERGRVWRHVRG